ncbi:MAG TPA: S8 family serine peptidase [Phycisphaerales bacterium]|nr:S8 family serine peptidase [Phycisphaerales bacterium]
MSSIASASGIAAPEPADVSIAAFSGNVYRDRVYVRFVNELSVREDGKNLRELHGVALPNLPAGTWSRLHMVSDDALEAERQLAQNYWKRELPDLRNEFVLTLAPGISLEDAINNLRTLPNIAHVAPLPLPAPPPLPPDYRANQGYLNASPAGTAPSLTWTWPGGRGQAVRVTDIEYSFNAAHEDLPPISIAGPTGSNPFADNYHGTAVLSVMFGRDNNWGVVGGVPDATKAFAFCYFGSYNLAAGVTNASNASVPGDLILIEQQQFGPVSSQYVPSEWSVGVYNAIVQAVGAGRIVIAAAGNGSQNLDLPIYSTGNGGHWPFLAANDSGAIIVGAGAAATGFSPSTTPRSRLSFSCYGSRVNVQGWGERVHAAGYGSAFSTEGINRYFTAGFNGTSSASPTVTNAAAAVASVYESVTGSVLTPAALRSALIATGAAQQSGTNPSSQNIGPLPNAVAALYQVLNTSDCNGNQVPDRIDIAMGTADANGDLIPDVCQPAACDDIDFNNNDIFPEDQDVIDFLGVLAGSQCASCSDIDFNNNGVFPEDQDVVDFFNVLAGGQCP